MEILNKIQDIVYPRRCPVCDGTVVFGTNICNECAGELKCIKETYCLKCGRKITDSTKELCNECTGASHIYDRGRVIFLYDDVMKDSMYRFKYGKRREYAGYYADEIVRVFGKELNRWNVDALIPIPIYKNKLKKRGYNQAEILANAIGKVLKIPVKSDVLLRLENTEAQKELGILERQNNLKKAFKIRGDVVELKNVVLIDDIYTTGSTIDAAAACLKAVGVKKVYFIALGAGGVK